MSQDKRRGGPVLAAGLGGFALGAATVLFVLWAYGVPRPAPTPGPAVPRPIPAPGTPPAQAMPRTFPDSGATPAPVAPEGSAGDLGELRRHRLLLPVQGIRREQLSDSFNDARTGHRHEAVDIMAPRNTPVLAVEDGRLAKLFVSRQGGNTLYQIDPSQTYTYYYAHLERYADGVHEGDLLHRGQVIGYVGSSGNASPDAPHLHFAIFRLPPDKSWWKGAAIDPFTVLGQF